MKIFIITMDDPIQTNGFIKEIIKSRKDDIIGLAVPNGDRLTIGKRKSKINYLISLLFIMGFYHFLKNSIKLALFKMRKFVAYRFKFGDSPSILKYAEKQGIETYEIKSPNERKFLEKLKSLNPDVIINQSQCFLKKDLLAIPKLGVLNRHNSLLPKNRGRLSPFWVLYKGEKETGVSIHFVEEEIDSGNIIVQKKIKVEKKDNFNSLVKKCYEKAPQAMLEALDKLEQGYFDFLENDDSQATYNSIPTLKQAVKFRLSRIFILFKNHQPIN